LGDFLYSESARGIFQNFQVRPNGDGSFGLFEDDSTFAENSARRENKYKNNKFSHIQF
jgi:hypothetical protein